MPPRRSTLGTLPQKLAAPALPTMSRRRRGFTSGVTCSAANSGSPGASWVPSFASTSGLVADVASKAVARWWSSAPSPGVVEGLRRVRALAREVASPLGRREKFVLVVKIRFREPKAASCDPGSGAANASRLLGLAPCLGATAISAEEDLRHGGKRAVRRQRHDLIRISFQCYIQHAARCVWEGRARGSGAWLKHEPRRRRLAGRIHQ